MDFGIVRVFESLMNAAGWRAAVCIAIGLVVLVRLVPGWLEGRRKDAQALQARVDSKDAILEKILTNHISHLETQLEASREFYTIASERLSSISNEMKEARNQLDGLHMLAEDAKDDLNFLKGRSS